MNEGYTDQPEVKDAGDTMVIINRVTREHIAEYRMTPGFERQELRQMRKAIREHLANGGTIGNYQW